jgi:ribonucleotide reductase beta subunit family protein with ferritin-like domain
MEDAKQSEPLLRENPNRYVALPIQYDDIFRMYRQQIASFWDVEEIDLSQDTKDWESLDENEHHFIKHVLAFFAASDGIVMENLAQRFMGDIQIPEARMFYAFQIAMESIHSHMYALLIDTYIKDDEEKTQLFQALDHIPCIRRKADWALKWIESGESFAVRLLAFAAVEGIFFSGSFCAIYWLRKRHVMPGLTLSNDLISRDEGLHTEFACLLYKYIQHRVPEQTVHTLIREAVDIETSFVCDALPVSLIGMNKDSMSQYIQFVADRLLLSLGYKKLYLVENPFEWMNMISLAGKTNFFERRTGEYARGAMDISNLNTKPESHEFALDESF